MDYFSLAITSLILGLIIGGLSRIDRLRPFMWICGIGTMITLVSYVVYVQDYINNPTIEGVYSFIYMVIPFVISSAFLAKGEEIAKTIGRR